MKSFLNSNNIRMYSTHNEGIFVFAERFIRTLEKQIYKYMTSISKTLYINKLDDIVNKCNSICQNTVKMKPVDVNSSTYIDSNNEFIAKNPKFKIGDIDRTSKDKNMFVKSYTPRFSEDVLMIKKLKVLCRGLMLLVILMVKKLLEGFTKKNCKKQCKKILKLKKQ